MSPNAKKDESKVVAAKPKAEEVVVAEKVEEAPAMPEFKVSAFIAPGAPSWSYAPRAASQPKG